MNTADFEFLSAILKQRSGLVLTEEKAYLLESRLMPVARKFGFAGLPELVATVRLDRPEDLLSDITEAMTTNESLFFRDMKPFEQLRTLVIPQLVQKRAGQRTLRIWSAASSSGQEPYSIGILLKELGDMLEGWNVEMLATDIYTDMLNRARAGLYTQFEVQRGLPIATLVKYFKQVDEKWRLDASICSMVKFQEFNLLDDTAPLGQFDIVFCRNVLIYFDQQTKSEVLGRISKVMPDDGVLYLGGAETVLGITEKFVPINGHRGMYAIAGGEPALKSA